MNDNAPAALATVLLARTWSRLWPAVVVSALLIAATVAIRSYGHMIIPPVPARLQATAPVADDLAARVAGALRPLVEMHVHEAANRVIGTLGAKADDQRAAIAQLAVLPPSPAPPLPVAAPEPRPAPAPRRPRPSRPVEAAKAPETVPAAPAAVVGPISAPEAVVRIKVDPQPWQLQALFPER